MRFYTQQHRYYCGIDLHAKHAYLCVLNADGEIVHHQNGSPAPWGQPLKREVGECLSATTIASGISWLTQPEIGLEFRGVGPWQPGDHYRALQ